MFIVKTTTTDRVYAEKVETKELARKRAALYKNTGYSKDDIFYTPAHTIKVEIIPMDEGEEE